MFGPGLFGWEQFPFRESVLGEPRVGNASGYAVQDGGGQVLVHRTGDHMRGTDAQRVQQPADVRRSGRDVEPAGGRSLSPQPRGSGAITWCRPAWTGIRCRHSYQVCGQPCSSTTGSPSPAATQCIRISPTCPNSCLTSRRLIHAVGQRCLPERAARIPLHGGRAQACTADILSAPIPGACPETTDESARVN
jgi:hypothetical protein